MERATTVDDLPQNHLTSSDTHDYKLSLMQLSSLSTEKEVMARSLSVVAVVALAAAGCSCGSGRGVDGGALW